MECALCIKKVTEKERQTLDLIKVFIIHSTIVPFLRIRSKCEVNNRFTLIPSTSPTTNQLPFFFPFSNPLDFFYFGIFYYYFRKFAAPPCLCIALCVVQRNVLVLNNEVFTTKTVSPPLVVFFFSPHSLLPLYTKLQPLSSSNSTLAEHISATRISNRLLKYSISTYARIIL